MSLKACPFCGSIAHVQTLKKSVTPRYFIACGNAREHCIASEHNVFGMFYTTVSDAVNAWNRRVDDDNQGRT